MRQKSGRTKDRSETVIGDIRRATRRRFSAEEKIRIVLDGLRGEIDPGFAMLHQGKRDSHIDPPASSNAIMRRARAPTAGENSEPGRHITRSLTFDPRVREPSANLGRFEGREGGSA